MNSSAFMENLRQLFADCDTDNNGSLGREEFRTLCAKIGLSKEAASETFDRLDIDKNDRITFDEFAAGFNQYKSTSTSSSSSSSSPAPAPSSAPTPPPSAQSQPQQQSQTSQSNKNNVGEHYRQQTPPMSPQPPARSSPTARNHHQKLSPSPVASRARKSASPLGLLSLGSAGGSSGNLIGQAGRSSSSANTADASSSISLDYNSSGDCGLGGSSQEYNNSASLGGIGHTTNSSSNSNNNMIVYSSDMINDNNVDCCDQSASGSGQFGSLVSSSGSLNQVRNMQDLLECVQKLQSENQILTQIFFKDKREREEYISQLGEEFDQQVREVEERANRRAKEELESEKRRLREMMAAERETLQHHYQTIEKMSKVIKSSDGKLNDESDSIHKVRSKLEDTYLENRQLKRSLLDTKTDVAMIWKEMEKLKKQYEDKLSSAYEKNIETRSECDHIKQQLTLMKDSNRKLQDASDVITNYITDKVEPVIKNIDDDNNSVSGNNNNFLNTNHLSSINSMGGASSQSNSRRGSILSEYLNGAGDDDDDDDDENNDYKHHQNDSFSRGSNKNNNKVKFLNSTTEEESTTSAGSSLKPPKAPPRGTATNHLLAPNSTTASGNINEKKVIVDKISEQKLRTNNQQEKLRNSINDKNQTIDSITKPQAPARAQQQSQQQLDNINKIATKQVELQQQNNPPTTKNSIKNIGRHFFIGSRTQSDADVSSKDTNSLAIDSSLPKSASLDTNDEPIVEPADGPSKATFNIILVGDSFVGKSSFAARFMEGSFVQGLISNCSIDFKTKSYKVDGTNYTVNLWDTAGQERFRSITASYFRKADGIILMYDVTDKRSYLNVRNWMSTISDTASENVAVLLIGNKIDLRQTDNKDKCVPTEEGFRLASEYEIVFLETSVKTGTNLVPSMGKLIRLIAKNNAPAEEDDDRIRLNDKSKVFNCMPKNC